MPPGVFHFITRSLTRPSLVSDPAKSQHIGFRLFFCRSIMNSLRCVGLLMWVFLSGCDADKSPAPPPKVAAQAPAVVPADKAPEAAVSVQKAPESAPVVHELKPNVNVVPVIANTRADPAKTDVAKKATTPAKAAAIEQKTPSVNAKSAKVKADNAEVANRAPVASKSKTPAQVVKDTRLPKASLDLSLPPDMVKQLNPPANVITANGKTKAQPVGGKPLLPKMFPDSEAPSDFQLQGRLLSNEMELQLRNEARKEVDGAALDFKFKQ
ncbi:translation initiation factor 2 [Pseudomonas sp. NPDC088444]|uniref:translation initiation factor 2 n=1 Tax=Pseudomonas sp. NPDC088444 TaxID=3364456 RepID=UPI00384E7F67